MEDISIPVIVDAVRGHGDFQITRCVYFSIECDSPSSGWTITLNGRSVPFLMLGLSGILYFPCDRGALFENADDIDDLFDTIENHPDLYVTTNDIWLPSFLFAKSPQDLALFSSDQMRGQVYRIGEKLFSNAFLYRNGTMSWNKFETLCANFQESVRFSEEETQAFLKWEKKHVERARNMYREKPELQLRRKSRKTAE